MKQLLLFFFVFTLVNTNIAAQNRCSYQKPRHAENWIFSNNIWMEFANEVDVKEITNVERANGSAVWSDNNGNLIAYSDGSGCLWNKNQELLECNLFIPGSQQPSLFVPKVDSDTILYLFTTDMIIPGYKGLRMYTVNIKDIGLIVHDSVLLSDAVPVIASTYYPEENFYWVVSHQLDNNKFFAYKVGNGINSQPVISEEGTSISSNIQGNESIAELKFSVDGNILAMVSYGKGTIELFTFNKSSGEIKYVHTIQPSGVSSDVRPNNIEFSPDGTKLYAILSQAIQTPSKSLLFQYDLEESYNEVSINGSAKDVCGIQLAPDGKIYVTRKNSLYMGIIENPNREGLECNFNDMGLYLEGERGLSGLPNFVSSFLDVKPIDFDTKCYGDTTNFKVLNNSNTESILWDFGDEGSEGNTLTTTNGTASYVYSEPGDYVVTYTEINGTKSWTHQVPVTIYPLPENNLRQAFPSDTAFIMKDGSSSIQLWAQEGMFSYEWTPGGSTDISYTVTAPGECSVTVEDMNCCRLKSTLFVEELDPKIPNAIKRSSTLSTDINRVFKPLAPPDGVADYSMKIFNKWGQMLFESNDLSIGWDGKVNSTNAPEGIYLWYITLNVARNQMNKGMFKLSGTLMLLD